MNLSLESKTIGQGLKNLHLEVLRLVVEVYNFRFEIGFKQKIATTCVQEHKDKSHSTPSCNSTKIKERTRAQKQNKFCKNKPKTFADQLLTQLFHRFISTALIEARQHLDTSMSLKRNLFERSGKQYMW